MPRSSSASSAPTAAVLAVSTSFGPTCYFDSAPPGLSLLGRGRDCSILIWPRLGVRAWVAGRCHWWCWWVAGEGAAVGALGLELFFGSLGAGPFGLGERVCRGELGLVVLAEGVTFAGSVGAELGCQVAGVGLGLAGAADLGAGGVPGLAGGGDRVVAFAGAAVSVGAGGGGLLVSAGRDGGDLRGGVAAQLGGGLPVS